MKSKSHGIAGGIAFVLLSTVLVPVASADCGYSMTPQWAAGILSPASRIKPASGADSGREDGDSKQASVVGLWHVTVSEGSQVVIQSIEAFHVDGTETLNDTGAPSGGNVCLGVWIQSGQRTYKLKHPFWRWDSAGNLIGSAVIRAQLTVDPHGNTFSGNATVDILDLSGNLIVEVTQQVAGERITVDF